jgi:hypothetical protein
MNGSRILSACHCEERERTRSRSVIRAMNHFPDCHREKRSDVAIQLIDCSRALPQSPRLLRNDKRGKFICRGAKRAVAIQLDCFVASLVAMTDGGYGIS